MFIIKLRQQIAAGIDNLHTEVIWYYTTTSSEYNDQYVVFNYGESSPQLQIWYPGTEARTSWIDASVYPNPFGTKFNSTSTGTFPVIVGEDGLGQTVYFEHHVGTDQVNPDGSTTAITSTLTSFDFDLGIEGTAGEFFLAMRRFIPDFKNLQGNIQMILAVKRYPSESSTDTALSPFTITTSTTKVDTRARGRFANINIANTGISEDWRFGTLRLDLQPDGRR
jgi:hypothetical protein